MTGSMDSSKYNGQTVIQIAKGGSHVYRRKKMNP